VRVRVRVRVRARVRVRVGVRVRVRRVLLPSCMGAGGAASPAPSAETRRSMREV
tara:strand:- start:183 stop:344 length:162 start_codon:yes stop_codon:yes gene_type:complete